MRQHRNPLLEKLKSTHSNAIVVRCVCGSSFVLRMLRLAFCIPLLLLLYCFHSLGNARLACPRVRRPSTSLVPFAGRARLAPLGSARLVCLHDRCWRTSRVPFLGKARLTSLFEYYIFLGGNARDNMGLVVLQQRRAPRKMRAGVVGL